MRFLFCIHLKSQYQLRGWKHNLSQANERVLRCGCSCFHAVVGVLTCLTAKKEILIHTLYTPQNKHSNCQEAFTKGNSFSNPSVSGVMLISRRVLFSL